MIPKFKALSFCLFIAILGVFVSLTIAWPAQAASGKECKNRSERVKLSPSNPKLYKIFYELCWQGSLKDKPLQILTHGLTYDHHYWDSPYKPQTYSYVREAAKHGYVTLNIDRIGIGRSDKPPALKVNQASQAFINHQLIQKLRAGMIEDVKFSKIIAVGHSYGSIISILEAATYKDVDKIILTGYMHEPQPEAFSFLDKLYPANQDPKFISAGLPKGYLTTMPGVRTSFFNLDFVDPKVVALDEKLKQTTTTGEINESFVDLETSSKIEVPVLMVVGQKDFAFCNESLGDSCANQDAVLARENKFFNQKASLKAYVQKLSGHDNNLHPNAQKAYRAMINWIEGS